MWQEGAAEKTLGLPHPGTDRPAAGWMTQGEWLRKEKARKGPRPTPWRRAVSWFGGSVPHVSRRVMSERPRLNRLRLGPAPGLAPIFHSPDSEALPCAGSSGAPSFSSTFVPGRLGREWLLSVTTSVAQARASPGRSGEGRLAWALLGVHSLSPPLKPKPRNSPCASPGTAKTGRLGTS